MAELLESRFPAIVETEPELLAHHLTEAGLTERAIGHWQVAGKRAADRSANPEAVGHLTRALDLVESLAAGPGRDNMELDLCVDMINPIIAANRRPIHDIGGTRLAANKSIKNCYDGSEKLCRARH